MLHLAGHSDHLALHLWCHLVAWRSTARLHLVRHAAHVVHVHHGLSADIVVSVSERTSVLVRALATALVVLTDVSLIVGWIDTERLVLLHLVAALPSLRHRLSHELVLALEPGVTAHAHAWRPAIETAATSARILARKVVVILVEATTIVWRVLVRIVEVRLPSTRAAWVGDLVHAASRHAATGRVASVLTRLVQRLSELGLPVSKHAIVAHLAISIVLEVSTQLRLIFRVHT